MAIYKGNRPKLANCSPNDVFRALRKIGGLIINTTSAKHVTVTHIQTGKKSTIPRSNPVNRHLLKDFIDEFLVKELGYTEEEIYKHLWC